MGMCYDVAFYFASKLPKTKVHWIGTDSHDHHMFVTLKQRRFTLLLDYMLNGIV